MRSRCFLLLTFFMALQVSGYALDSLRTENVNGKLYIIHRVDPQETLFSLSRRYNVPVDVISSSNPIVSSGLKIGDILRIPYVVQNPRKSGNIHMVKSGETLFAISQVYGVSVNELRDVNELQDNDLIIGQELLIPQNLDNKVTQVNILRNSLPDTAVYQYHVVQQGETLFALSRQYNRNVNDLIEWNRIPNNNISIGDSLIVSYKPVVQKIGAPAKETVITYKEPVKSSKPPEVKEISNDPGNPVVISSSEENVEVTREIITNEANYEEVVETGLAELIQNSGDTRKYLALHRTAKIGTIIRVRNEMNDQEVFVRVLGKLPDTGVNDKVLLKISQAAYDRLGAIDKRFRVRISFFPD